MKGAYVVLLGVLVLGIGVAVITWPRPPGQVLDLATATVDIAAGEKLYAQSCAVCHGTNLEGQENWQSPGPDGRMPAPPHDETGHTWHHTDTVLFEYTKLGGRAALAQSGLDFESGMPGFGEVLTDQEIWNILAYIKSTWPTRIQEIQAERTNAEN